MPYIILFTDNPDADPQIRTRLMPDHLAFLEAHSAEIGAAGPLSSPSGDPAGGLWIVDASTEDRVRALIRADPFWPTGLRAGYEILNWRQVFAEGKRLV
ncbi:MAG: YciI family protein [Pseudomonadota bacterium]